MKPSFINIFVLELKNVTLDPRMARANAMAFLALTKKNTPALLIELVPSGCTTWQQIIPTRN